MNELCNRQSHFSRRTLLGAGTSSVFLSTLATLLARADEVGVTKPKRPLSVILLWLEGGPSQLETFDPHPDSRIGGDTKAIETSAKGIRIAEMLPNVAEQMHLASIIRSVTGKEGDHQRAVYNIKTGFRPDPTLIHPSIGAVLCEANPSKSDLPRHISILSGASPGRGGYLGGAFDAFKIGDPAGPVPDVRRTVDEDRYAKRIDDLKNVVEKEFRRGRLQSLEAQRTLHTTATDAALRMMSSEQLQAFDVSSEPQKDRDSFGDTSFGRGCLAAARLIEAGTRCVEVTLGGWDSHINNHSLQSSACEILDPALASLLRRLKERELLDTTLVVCGGEFGRTPIINVGGGRDHWPHGFSTLLAGCGVRPGQTFGETSPDPKLDRKQPLADVAEPVTVADVHATILDALGVRFSEELYTSVGRPIKRSEGVPIRSLLN